MTPAAVARPLLRPGPRLLLEKLGNSSSRQRRAGIVSLQAVVVRPSPVCLGCSFRARIRFYSTDPPKQPLPSSSAPEKLNATDEASPRPEELSASSNDPSTKTTSSSAQTSSTPQPDEAPSSASSPTSSSNGRSSHLSERFSTFMDNFQSRVLVASQALNDLTGYTAIDAIKASNARLEAELAAAQSALRAARANYKSVNERRAATQREVTALLARKDTWSPADLERFTELYRLDHEVESRVAEAAQRLTDAEAEESRLGAALNAGILRRYHEEQVWSDRIRRQSTWGTWGLMGVNVLLFLVLQFVAEPWRRARLVRGVAAEEGRALEEVRKELVGVRQALERREVEEAAEKGEAVIPTADGAALPAVESPAAAAEEAIPVTALSWKEMLSDPGLWRPALEDLYSERRIDLRMRDVSLIAVEGAVAGAAVMAGIAALAFRRA
ncbi:hypothetical protein NKR23_g8736 [Pleurostoma richardsiae]|uniref:Sensitive to high expression protein 9, mitochondrial n=1 Tax=Pleurostoma richardsiae TaxID=41990 RepID=A0AA38VFG0_9PEZI|nr:hypothetical protein NKR23_g8736 [Pleurostoma richardsiae]